MDTDARRPRRSRQAEVREDMQVLPLRDTRVTFPAGGLTAEAEVLAVVPLNESGTGFVTDLSPFHPVDPSWADQGADGGTVVMDGVVADVVDVVLGAIQGQNLLISTNIPVRRGAPGWVFVVVHVLADGDPAPAVGRRVELRVDPVRREALSYGHTACHIAALALNAALADRWRKPVPLDGLGHANFDRQALAVSRIHPDSATDTYRLGKSLRKKGFDAAGLSVDAVAEVTNKTLARWVAGGAVIRVVCDGPGVTDRRTWVCELPDGTERIACGGTHVTSLAGVASIEVGLTLTEFELVMETKVTRRGGISS